MRAVVTGVFTAALALACTGGTAPTEREPWPAGDLRAEQGMATFAVYHLEALSVDPKTLVNEIGDGRLCLVDSPPMADFEASPLVAWNNVGVLEAENDRIVASKAVTVMSCTYDADKATAHLHEISLQVAKLADETQGVLWDEDTRQYYSRAAWQERLDDLDDGSPDVARHMVLHNYRDDDGLMRFVTLGMRKFALPDLVVNSAPANGGAYTGQTVNLAAQTMVDSPSIAAAGRLPVSIAAAGNPTQREVLEAMIMGLDASRAETIGIGIGVPAEGDADNRLVELTFSQHEGATVTERHEAFLAAFFGTEKTLSYTTHDDALLAASGKSLEELQAYKPEYQANGLELGEMFIVKAGFPTTSDPGSNEWMWVEVASWDEKGIHGVLLNEPAEVEGLHAGATVTITEDTFFDYRLEQPDGSYKGYHAGKLLEERAGMTP